jgi:NAD(P)H dehydrogenase (quinone)
LRRLHEKRQIPDWRRKMAKVLVVYHSGTGNTKAMAQAVTDGVKDVAGVEAVLKEADQVSVSDLVNADALAFGSPTYFSYMAGVVKAIFDKAYPSRSQIRGKPFAAFASGGGGEVKSVQSIESVAASCGLRKVCEGVAVGGMPTESESQDCRKLGATLARASKK